MDEGIDTSASSSDSLSLPSEDGARATGGGESDCKLAFSVLDVLTRFRDQIRQLAREKQGPAAFLSACDALRDDILPELGKRNYERMIDLKKDEGAEEECMEHNWREEGGVCSLS